MYFFGRRNISAVKQLYKKGDNISMTNYRATSLLFFFLKSKRKQRTVG